jgi:hypothetical protein
MGQVKVINNMNQRIELMLQNEVTKVMKGIALAPRAVKIINAGEVTPQLTMLSNKKLITLVELG